jgi:3-hydroxyacyl-[acyl-carrier-protein] dehydratase
MGEGVIEARNGLTDLSANAGTGALDIQQIMQMIMHRYPLLLVDRVIDCVPGDHIIGLKNISRSESFFRTGLRQPSMPTLLLIEALAQISVILTYKTLRIEPTGKELMFFAGIDDGHFEGVVQPGDVLRLRSDVVRLRKKMGWFKATAHVDDKCVAKMAMLAAIQVG